MPHEGLLVKSVILAAAIIELFIFFSLTAAALFLMSVGIVLVISSLLFENRFLSLLAVTILGAEAGFSLRIESVLEIRMLLSTILGIFLPLFAIGILVLGPKTKLETEKLSSKRHLYLTLAVICVCLLAVPIASVLLSILAITILLQVSTLIEVAIMIVVIAVCTIIGTMFRPKKNRMKMEGTEVG